MKYTVLVMTIALLLREVSQALFFRQMKAFKQPRLADIVFTDTLLFDKNARSLTDCAKTCLGKELCTIFTLSASSESLPSSGTSKPFRCRGHTRIVKPADGAGSESAPGTEFFMLVPRVSAWLEKPCTSTPECESSAEFSECFSGQCLCNPFYIYSYLGDSCVAACPEQELQTKFIFYNGYRIEANNIRCVHAQAADCVSECRALPTCRSLEFWAGSGICCMNNVTASHVPSNFVTGASSHFYTRTCL